MRLRPLQVSGVSSTVTCAEQLCGCVFLSLRCCQQVSAPGLAPGGVLGSPRRWWQPAAVRCRVGSALVAVPLLSDLGSLCQALCVVCVGQAAVPDVSDSELGVSALGGALLHLTEDCWPWLTLGVEVQAYPFTSVFLTCWEQGWCRFFYSEGVTTSQHVSIPRRRLTCCISRGCSFQDCSYKCPDSINK